MMRCLFCLPLLAGLAAGPVLAQDPSPEALREMKSLPMQSVLWNAQRLVESDAPAAGEPNAASDLSALLPPSGLVVVDGRVHVEIVGPDGSDASLAVDTASLTRGFDLVVDRSYSNRIDAWANPRELIALAAALPAGWTLEKAAVPTLDAVAGEGPNDDVTNSVGYRTGGANGNGVVIAVIDQDWTGLTAARNNGDAPPTSRTTQINLATGSFETGTTHGTGCLEAAYDHCPGATWRLYKVDSAADIGAAVTDAIANGCDVISHSMSWYNLGWADDSGAVCAGANQASNAGINFCTSAGNRALDHWQGTFNSGNGDVNRHDWSTGDESLSLNVVAGTTAGFNLAWNTSGGTFDYDLYLLDSSGNTVLASSTSGGNTFESISWMNTNATDATVLLQVRRVSGGATEFEVFGDNNSYGYEYSVAAGSTTCPSNATGVNVLSIGAVTWSAYDSANGSTPIANYSGQGPSNSGMLLPDLTGPTDTKGFTYSSGFGGTSCATPNVAGAITAFWSDKTLWFGNATRWLILAQAVTIWRDWGVPGPDNVYGYGAVRLVDFTPNTTWVARDYGNVGNTPNGPYYTVAAAQSAATSGGRLLFMPGGIYPELVSLTKALTVESWGGTATLGS